MFKRENQIIWMVLGGICTLVSCNSLSKPPSMSVATSVPAITSPNTNTVSIEIFIIRLEPEQGELLQQLWREVDEQSLPAQLRRELFAEGFRVGVLGNLVSPALARLLNISGNAKTDTSWGEFQEVSAADAAHATVIRHARNLLPEMSALIKVFDEQNSLPELSLFRVENGLFCGQTYQKATGLFSVSATVNKDGSAQLQITPTVEHGDIERRYRVVAGMAIQDESKPRHTFESLKISQKLLPGQWLIMGTTTPDSTGAGKAFFVRQTPILEQRLLAIRLAHVSPVAAPSPANPPPNTPRVAGTMPERY